MRTLICTLLIAASVSTANAQVQSQGISDAILPIPRAQTVAIAENMMVTRQTVLFTGVTLATLELQLIQRSLKKQFLLTIVDRHNRAPEVVRLLVHTETKNRCGETQYFATQPVPRGFDIPVITMKLTDTTNSVCRHKIIGWEAKVTQTGGIAGLVSEMNLYGMPAVILD
jgi:hypothetical protein